MKNPKKNKREQNKILIFIIILLSLAIVLFAAFLTVNQNNTNKEQIKELDLKVGDYKGDKITNKSKSIKANFSTLDFNKIPKNLSIIKLDKALFTDNVLKGSNDITSPEYAEFYGTPLKTIIEGKIPSQNKTLREIVSSISNKKIYAPDNLNLIIGSNFDILGVEMESNQLSKLNSIYRANIKSFHEFNQYPIINKYDTIALFASSSTADRYNFIELKRYSKEDTKEILKLDFTTYSTDQIKQDLVNGQNRFINSETGADHDFFNDLTVLNIQSGFNLPIDIDIEYSQINIGYYYLEKNNSYYLVPVLLVNGTIKNFNYQFDTYLPILDIKN